MQRKTDPRYSYSREKNPVISLKFQEILSKTNKNIVEVTLFNMK